MKKLLFTLFIALATYGMAQQITPLVDGESGLSFQAKFNALIDHHNTAVDSTWQRIQVQSLLLNGNQFTGSWNDLSDIPAGFADGTDDGLADGNDFLIGGEIIDTDLILQVQNQGSIIIPLGIGSFLQELSLTGNNLSISNGNTVDLTPFINTDNQILSIVGNNLSITGGNTVTLPSATPTSDDYLTSATFTPADNSLELAVSNQIPILVDLSPLQDGVGTDDQTASEVGNIPSGNLTSINVQAALNELQNDIDNLSSGGSDGNDFVTGGFISGTNLTLTIPNQTDPIINLASLQDGFEANTDNQVLNFTSPIIGISGGNSIDISSIDTNTQLSEAEVDAFVSNNGYLLSEVDGSVTNELQDLSLSGNILSLSGDPSTIDLSGYLDNTDTQLSEAEVDAFVANNGYLVTETNNLTGTVTWANVPDANITQSSVTQHQGALTITESQVSDLGNYVPSNTTGITGATAVNNIVHISQADYDAIGTPDANTLYIINN